MENSYNNNLFNINDFSYLQYDNYELNENTLEMLMLRTNS